MSQEKKMPLGRQIIHLNDFDAETDQLESTYGTTDLYSMGSYHLDQYFGGGFGRRNGYEIVVLFGSTGIGKSTFALNMIKPAIESGGRIGLLMLEDDGADVNAKMRRMFGNELSKYRDQIHFTPSEIVDGSKLWGLEDLLGLVEEWYIKRNLDIIVLDPLQFAFESAMAIKGENEYIAQRVFVRKINYLLRRLKKTIILVSHVGKSSQLRGMDRIVGSSGIAASATKTIEIKKDGDLMLARFWKSRFTQTPNHDKAFKFSVNHLIIRANEDVANQTISF